MIRWLPGVSRKRTLAENFKDSQEFTWLSFPLLFFSFLSCAGGDWFFSPSHAKEGLSDVEPSCGCVLWCRLWGPTLFFSLLFFFCNVLCESLLSHLPGSSRYISICLCYCYECVFHNNLGFWLWFRFYEGVSGSYLTRFEISELLVLPLLCPCTKLVKGTPLEPDSYSVGKYLLFVHRGMAELHGKRLIELGGGGSYL